MVHFFSVRADQEGSSVSAIRVVYSFPKNGTWSYLLKAADNSSIEVLRGSGVPSVKVSVKAVRWIERTIADCHRRLRRAIDPDLLV